MCFTIDNKHPDRKIAKRNIVCYKLLFKDFLSPYQRELYKLNDLSTSILEYPKESSFYTFDDYKVLHRIREIRIGIHSYSNKKNAIHAVPNVIYYMIVKGIIPEGSEYYYNSIDKEYVSNQIILQEIIK